MLTRTLQKVGFSRALATAAWLVLLAALVLLPAPAMAQNQEEEHSGVNSGNYNIKQVFEFGYRFEGTTGNRNVYNTFVNLNPGPRLLEHSLEMRSLNHQGVLFDNFSLHSFGYGGDPNNVTRLRAYKNRWYNFNATFRRDRNFWDYRLLANPLNPNTYVASVPAGTPFFNIPYSPHRMEITRRMTDVNMTFAPQSPIRVRLGYSRNISEGPSLSTFRESADAIALQNWKNSLNSYQIGFDFKLFPKTNLSFDQFWHEYKGDTTWVDPMTNGIRIDDIVLPRPSFQLSTGQQVDFGTTFNFSASSPCASTVASPFIINAASTPYPTAKAACNGFLAFQRAAKHRASYPASQFSFQTSFIPNFDISGRMVYSSTDANVLGDASVAGYLGTVNTSGFSEIMQGLSTRTNRRESISSGPANAQRKSWTGDFGITWYIGEHFRITDQFRYEGFRISGLFELVERSLFPVNPAAPQPAAALTDAVANFVTGLTPPANCPTITSVGCPRHTSSSPADIISRQFGKFLKQRSITNQVDVAVDVNRHFGGHVGYRFRDRIIKESFRDASDSVFFPTLPNRGGCTPGTTPAGRIAVTQGDNSCRLTVLPNVSSHTEAIDEHSFLFGLWARPTDKWRLSYDMELLYADHAFTRISPRQRQRYKFRAAYNVTEWANLAGNINILEQRNNVLEIFHTQHNRTYAFAVSLMPPDKWWGLDFGYDYNDIDSRTNICFTLTTVPLPPGSTPCANPGGSQTTSAISTYDNKLHFAFINVVLQPVKRVTTRFGYSISSTSGETLILGPINSPTGTLAFNYHKPYAGVEIKLTNYVAVKSMWNYYGYNEKSPADVFTSPLDSSGNLVGRDFRGNQFMTSVRFTF